MAPAPVVLRLDAVPGAFAALRAAADVASELGAPLVAWTDAAPGPSLERARSRLALVCARRRVEHETLASPSSRLADLDVVHDGSLLVIARVPGRRRLALLGRILRAPGSPLLVVPPRARSIGAPWLVVESAADPGAPGVEDLVARLGPGATAVRVGALDVERAESAERLVRPNLIAVAASVRPSALAAALRSDPVERLVRRARSPLLIGRRPRLVPATPVAVH